MGSRHLGFSLLFSESRNFRQSHAWGSFWRLFSFISPPRGSVSSFAVTKGGRRRRAFLQVVDGRGVATTLTHRPFMGVSCKSPVHGRKYRCCIGLDFALCCGKGLFGDSVMTAGGWGIRDWEYDVHMFSNCSGLVGTISSGEFLGGCPGPATSYTVNGQKRDVLHPLKNVALLPGMLFVMPKHNLQPVAPARLGR